MKPLDFWSAMLVIALAVIAARVAVILARGGSAWVLIVGYWTILTVKNVIDAVRGSRR